MTETSPELAAFAASLNAQPDDVEDMYQYCLAMVMVETGQAELVKIELRGREPWCTFKSITGDTFVVLRPVLSQTQERELMETIWSIFHPNEGPLRVARPAPAASSDSDNKSTPPPPSPSLETQDWEGLVRRTPKRRRWKGELPRPPRSKKPAPPPAKPAPDVAQTPLTGEGVDELATVLRQLIEQAQAATETLRGMMEETRQVSEAAWEATKEHRLVLAEIRTAIRQYERARQENNALPRFARKHPEPEPQPTQRPPFEDRNKQLTLDVLGGMAMNEAGRKFGISPGRVKTIYMNQFYRLYHLKDILDLSPEDIAMIRGHEHPNLLTGQRPYANHIRELLERMWEIEKG